MAERLRRLTRNQMGSARAGSNPAGCEAMFCSRFQVVSFSHCPLDGAACINNGAARARFERAAERKRNIQSAMRAERRI